MIQNKPAHKKAITNMKKKSYAGVYSEFHMSCKPRYLHNGFQGYRCPSLIGDRMTLFPITLPKKHRMLWKGHLKIILSKPVAMSRDIFKNNSSRKAVKDLITFLRHRITDEKGVRVVS